MAIISPTPNPRTVSQNDRVPDGDVRRYKCTTRSVPRSEEYVVAMNAESARHHFRNAHRPDLALEAIDATELED